MLPFPIPSPLTKLVGPASPNCDAFGYQLTTDLVGILGYLPQKKAFGSI